ncbi:MAG TPA: hypothetical protein VLL54_20995 [Pyrinomonadaceae bacterium]|nr:hypothetical protein [Pyrinomonadaceae bacterium]
MSLKEREAKHSTASIAAFLAAITLLGVIGLGIMLGGTMALTKEVQLKEELVGFFMFFVFLITLITEILLIRQLSRFTSAAPKVIEVPTPATPLVDFRSAPPRALAEPLQSVTENTTRTLEYSRREQSS